MNEQAVIDNPPGLPRGVKVAEWMVILFFVFKGMILLVLAFTVPDSGVVIRLTELGSERWELRAESLAIRVLVSTVVLLYCTALVILAVYILKGRMWAYYLLAIGMILSIANHVHSLIAGNTFMLHLPILIVLLLFLLGGHSDFRDFSRYQDRKRHGMPPGQDVPHTA